MKPSLILSIIGMLMFQFTFAQTTYYTRTAGGATAWDDVNRWTLDPGGSPPSAGTIPSRTDHIVILSGQTVVIDALTDNGGTGQTADGLNLANVGAFAGSGTANFYHTGNITIEFGGTLTTSVRIMLEGATLVEGSLTTTTDFINLGQMEIANGGTLSVGDDFIISGTSKTIINNTSTAADDIYIDHTEARICGSGVLNIGNNPNSAVINYLNGATVAQICSGFDITCSFNCDPSLPVSGTGGFTFDLNQYNYAKTITIDNGQVAGDLTNFPVLVSYSDPSISTTADGGGVENSNGYDIIFATNSACGSVTQLDHQIESYSSNGTTGTLIAWVNVPLVADATDTEIFMYYGNASVTEDISVSSTYDTDYIAIWHMEEDPGGAAPQILDATITGYDATSNGTMSGNITGQIGNAIDFDGADDYLQTPSNELQTANNFTISSWFKADNTAESHIVWQGVGTQNGWGGVAGASQELNLSLGYCCIGGAGTPVTGDRLSFFLGDIEEENIPNVLSVDGGAFTETSNWHYLVGTISDMDGVGGTPTSELWLDGSSITTDDGVAGANLARNLWDTNLRIGRPGANERYFNGQLDEIRISTIVRSNAWIETEYNNQSSPGTFYTITPGASINPCGPLPVELLYFKGANQGNSNVLLWATSSEINNDFFTIERSYDGKSYGSIGIVTGAGNSKTTINYSYPDENIKSGITYYRLKQTDFDGTFSYSKLISVNSSIPATLDVNIYPNPNNGIFTLKGPSIIDKTILVTIVDISGKIIQQMTISNENPFLNYEMNLSSLPKGIYYLNMVISGGNVVKKLVLE